MEWIVMNEGSGGKIELVSRYGTNGLLPKGSYLTIEDQECYHVLRVDESRQVELYRPSPLIADLKLPGLGADSDCKNKVTAHRVYDSRNRTDGLVDFIKPQSIARRSTQDEIDKAIESPDEGPMVFVAAMQGNQNAILTEESGKYVTARLPEDMFYHQMMICGKTGSGKTVSMKYLMQHFVESIHGAVLAVNVKDVDLLMMDKPTEITNESIEKEWECIDGFPCGVEDFTIYKPANRREIQSGVSSEVCQFVGLDVENIDPESLAGLLHNISDKGAALLPSIFDYWRQEQVKNNRAVKFSNFIKYFDSKAGNLEFYTINSRGDTLPTKLHAATFDNILRSLNNASDYFDNEDYDVRTLSADDILSRGKINVIDVPGGKNAAFGSVLLRDLLSKIVESKNNRENDVPILIIIDEVHMFYDSSTSQEALGDLDTICRTGRSSKIGVIFASQNPSDIPSGLSSVIDTKIFFKTDSPNTKAMGIKVSTEELECLRPGYAIANIHDLPRLKILKFPMAFAGVTRNG